jgi:mannose-6-phosphate isomerase-like protein (cupin superfamily)
VATILDLSDLPGGDFEGFRYGDIASTFIWAEMKLGHGPKLHEHPYTENFIILDGQTRFTVGDETIESSGGQVLIAPPETPPAFINTATDILRQLDIHCGNRFITEWLAA